MGRRIEVSLAGATGVFCRPEPIEALCKCIESVRGPAECCHCSPTTQAASAGPIILRRKKRALLPVARRQYLQANAFERVGRTFGAGSLSP